jgi:Spy/CpxP family protein refolding chaperone
MKTKAIILTLALGAATCLLTAQDGNQRPDGQRPPGREGGPPGPGGPGGFRLLPLPAMEQLNLTADQRKQLADLEAQVKAKLEKILTSEQLKQLSQMRPPPRQGGPGGMGGPGGGPGGPGRRGGPGGQGGPGGEGTPQRPELEK